MTDSQSESIVNFLEKIEKHLQAIDWKLWSMHQQFGKETLNVNAEHTETPVIEENKVSDELESLAEIISTPVVSKEPEKIAVKHTLKYPSIEILK